MSRARTILALLLVLGLGAAPRVARADELEAWELAQPSIESLEARPIEELATAPVAGHFRSVYRAALEMSASLVGLYPERDLFFKVRNSEPVYYMTRLAMAGTPGLARVHAINLSSSGTIHHPDLPEYLRDRGLSVENVRSGMRPLFFDNSYFSGTTHRAFLAALEPEVREHVLLHTMVSYNPDVAGSRLASLELVPEVAESDPLIETRQHDHRIVLRWEFGVIPQFTGNSTEYQRLEGRWMAMARFDRRVNTGDAPVQDIAVKKEEAIAFLRGLKSFYLEPQTQARFRERAALWRGVRRMVDRRDLRGLQSLLLAQYRPGQERHADALSRDVLEVVHNNFGVTLTPELRSVLTGTHESLQPHLRGGLLLRSLTPPVSPLHGISPRFARPRSIGRAVRAAAGRSARLGPLPGRLRARR